MKDDKETKERLLLSAKKEFLEKGYMQASLRNICKNAEVTTGALYFFFQNKEDLFACLVEKPLNELYEIINQHHEREWNPLNAQADEVETYLEHFEIAKQAVHCIYHYYDEFQLLLTKAQGSGFAQIDDQFVERLEKKYRVMADHISLQNRAPALEDYMLHWFAHTQMNLFVHMITHERAEETAMKHLEAMMKGLVACWYQLFQE
ncbi:MAG: TetR/AcrR family transcriptional regulator [Clostridia bacterium]|nr:TetR/AcrR family transcriptional regulator [Anaerotignum sp.]NCC16023.1 TetR/AcrR family transcriptional regulator [Clostridia bacterium]